MILLIYNKSALEKSWSVVQYDISHQLNSKATWPKYAEYFTINSRCKHGVRKTGASVVELWQNRPQSFMQNVHIGVTLICSNLINASFSKKSFTLLSQCKIQIKHFVWSSISNWDINTCNWYSFQVQYQNKIISQFKCKHYFLLGHVL